MSNVEQEYVDMCFDRRKGRLKMFNKTLIVAFVLVVIATFFAYVNMAGAQDFIKDGLVSYWTLDKASIKAEPLHA